MGVEIKSDSHHEVVLVENASSASTSWSTTDDNQSNEILAEEILSTSKEEVSIKQEDSKVITKDSLPLQNADSKFEVCLVTSSNELSSPEILVTSSSEPSSSESQELKVACVYRVFDRAAAKLEETLEAEESDVCMADASNVQNSDNAAALTSQNSNESHLTKMPSEESALAVQESESAFIIEDSKSHRENIHYSSESSDYETDSSDSSDCEEYIENLRKSIVVTATKLPVLKTKGELLIEDLPPVEDLSISVSDAELKKIGSILHSVVCEERNEFLVVVESDGNSDPLDADSVLFLSSDNPLGKIHDVFGTVTKPKYVVRFNKAEDILNKGVTKGQNVYYSPRNDELTHFVLVDVLKKQKGSDASWKDNNEPPDDEIDYSDDEQEKLAKQKRRAKTRGKERNLDDEEEDGASNKKEKRDVTFSQKRDFKRGSRNVFQSPTPGPPRSSFRPYSPQSFGSAPPSSDSIGSSGLLRNTVSSQHFGPTSLNSVPFLQRNEPFPQNNLQFPQPFRPHSHSNPPSPQPFGPHSYSNVPSPQPFGPLSYSNAPSPQPFGPLSYSNAPSPQPLHQSPSQSNASSPQPFGQFPQSNAPSPQSFGQFPQSNASSPQPFGQFPHSNVPALQPFGQFPQSSVSSHQSFGSFPQGSVSSFHTLSNPSTYVLSSNLASSRSTFTTQLNPSSLMAAPQSNGPSPQGPFPQNNLQFPQSLGPHLHSNAQSQPFGSLSQGNVPAPQPFGQFPQSNVPTHQSFGQFPQGSVSSFQPFSGPSASYVLSPNLASSRTTCASQLNPSFLMAAPQSNVPLRQQLLLQSQQPITTFSSQPPPNYNSDQNSNFLRQHQSFTRPVFGTLPSARSTIRGENPLQMRNFR